MPSAPPKLFKKRRHREDDQSREMIWAFVFAQFCGASAASMKPEAMGRATTQAGLVADAAVAEWERRVEYEDVSA